MCKRFSFESLDGSFSCLSNRFFVFVPKQLYTKPRAHPTSVPCINSIAFETENLCYNALLNTLRFIFDKSNRRIGKSSTLSHSLLVIVSSLWKIRLNCKSVTTITATSISLFSLYLLIDFPFSSSVRCYSTSYSNTHNID